jgi:hypothetical protein
MVPESSAICLRSSRMLRGSGSSYTRGWLHEPLPLFDIKHKISLCPHQPLRRGGAVEVGCDQLFDFKGLKTNVTPEPGDVAIEQSEVAVHRKLRATAA